MVNVVTKPSATMTTEEYIATLKEDNTVLVEANYALKTENAALKTEVAALKAKVSELSVAIGAKDTVEVVAVPASKDVRVLDLRYEGELCERKEVEGYSHFIVPRKFAERLLTGRGGMKFLLTGQKEPLKAKRFNGLTAEEVTIYPHVLGEAGWKRADE